MMATASAAQADRSDGDVPFETELLLPTGVRFRLPRRRLGAGWLVSWFFTLFGLGFATVVPAMSVWNALNRGGGLDAFDIVWLVAQVPFMLAGLAFVVLGHVIRRSRCIVELTRDALKVTESTGLVWWSWSCPRDAITGVKIYKANLQTNGRPIKEGPLKDASVVRVETSEGPRLLIGVGYPLATCTAVAQALGERLDVPVEAADEEAVLLTALGPVGIAPPPPLEQPEGSNIEVEQFDDGVTLKVPPAGIRGTKGLFSFSVFWLAFISVFTAIFLGAFLSNPQKVDGPIWVIPLVISIFFLVGFAMLAGALNMARRRAVLAVVDRSLMVLQTGLFGSKRREWTAGEIQRIVCGPSGMSVNNRPVMELQIHPTNGKKFGLLAGRDNDELRWMAGLLSRTLGI